MAIQALMLMVSRHLCMLTLNLTYAIRFSAPTHYAELPACPRHNDHEGYQDTVRQRELLSVLSRSRHRLDLQEPGPLR